jgi:hypothetical protein
MIKHTLVFVRPDTKTPWFKVSEKFFNFRQENFILPGKMVSRDEVINNTELVKIVTTHWKDLESHAEFISTPNFLEMMQERKLHNLTHGITQRTEMQVL